MVDVPAAYLWSSYRANALGEHMPLVTPHPAYLSLGRDATERQTAYQELIATQLDAVLIQDVRSCLQTGTPLGNDRFRLQIEQALGVRVGYSRTGQTEEPAVRISPGP